MKTYILITLFCMLGITLSKSTHAFSIIYPGSVTSSTKDGKNLKLNEFIMLSQKDFSRLIGRKMNLKEKISFKLMKANMKHILKKHSNITVNEYLARQNKIGTGWWILIIAAGIFVLLLIMVIILTVAGAGL